MCRKLNADEIECRVSQVSEKGCSLLLYKTARVDRAILDETYGKMSWQNDFKVIDGKMYGGIGIFSADLKEWIWKWDCGTESNTEAEKGQASDCFKRAGFKWGIGVELYTAPFIFITAETVKNTKGKWELKNKYTKFFVKSLDYENDEIANLIIIDDKGNEVFNQSKKTKSLPSANNDKKYQDELKKAESTVIAFEIFKKYENTVKDSDSFKNLYKKVYLDLKKKEGKNE